MKTILPNFASRRRVPQTRLLAAAGFLLLLALMFLLRPGGENLFWWLASPVMSWRSGLEASQLGGLRAELASTTAALADRDVLYAENIELKAELGRVGRPQEIVAAILQRPPGVPYDRLVIDAGSRDGVAVGDLVSAGGTALVGTVETVFAASARVLLFSAPGQTYQGLLRGSVPIDIEGQGGGSMKAQVPSGMPVSPGDAVLIPGLGGGLSAEVVSVDAPEGESFHTLYLHLPANIFELRFVYVWKQQ